MKKISLKQLKRTKLHLKPVSYRIVEGNKIILKGQNKEKYLIEHIEIIRKGSHIQISNKNESITLSSRYEISLRKTIILILMIIAIFSLTILQGLYNASKPPIDERIKALDNINASLKNLGDYVNEQKNTLEYISTTIDKLNAEKTAYERILEIDKSKVDKLLEYQYSLMQRDTYIGYAISFIIGILSTFTASYILKTYRSYKENKKL